MSKDEQAEIKAEMVRNLTESISMHRDSIANASERIVELSENIAHNNRMIAEKQSKINELSE